MVTRERLQELINQGATIYEVKYGKVNPVLLKNKIRFVSEKYPVIAFEPRPNEKYKHHKYFDKLYETQAEAEWVAKMHTQRTEFFEPPTFENVREYRFIAKNGCKYGIEKIKTGYSIEKENPYVIRISKFYTTEFKDWDYTKDNYIKACEYAKSLFENG